MSIDLKKDEVILIQKLRSASKFSTIVAEKRPSAENPDGEITQIKITDSFLVKEIAIK